MDISVPIVEIELWLFCARGGCFVGFAARCKAAEAQAHSSCAHALQHTSARLAVQQFSEGHILFYHDAISFLNFSNIK
jgi:hypothetical protein